MNHFGEIEYLSSIVEPDVAVITNIGDSHIENLGSRENILKAKCEIFSHMDPKKGYVILNGDDPLLEPLRASLPFQSVLVGTAEGLDYRATGVEREASAVMFGRREAGLTWRSLPLGTICSILRSLPQRWRSISA